MNLPTEQQCLKYFEEYTVPENILQHCLQVRNVSVFLAEQLKKAGIEVDLDLVNCLALLHDLFKLASLKSLEPTKYYPNNFTAEQIEMWKKLKQEYPGMHENEIAFEILKDEYPKLAISLKNVTDPRVIDKTWEELVVHYSDWRILQTRIVSLKQRAIYLRDNYPQPKERWDDYENLMIEREKFIFSHLEFLPDKVAELIENGK